jgi:hypothetical protein
MRRVVGGMMLAVGVLMLLPLAALATWSGQQTLAVVAPVIPFVIGAYALVALGLLAGGVVIRRGRR